MKLVNKIINFINIHHPLQQTNGHLSLAVDGPCNRWRHCPDFYFWINFQFLKLELCWRCRQGDADVKFAMIFVCFRYHNDWRSLNSTITKFEFHLHKSPLGKKDGNFACQFFKFLSLKKIFQLSLVQTAKSNHIKTQQNLEFLGEFDGGAKITCPVWNSNFPPLI